MKESRANKVQGHLQRMNFKRTMQMMEAEQIGVDEAASDHRHGRHQSSVGVTNCVNGRSVVGQVDDGRLRGLAVQVDDTKDPLRNFCRSRTLQLIE